MYTKWNVNSPQRDTRLLSLSVLEKIEKSEKLKLSPEAQQKLIKLIKINTKRLTVKIPNPFHITEDIHENQIYYNSVTVELDKYNERILNNGKKLETWLCFSKFSVTKAKQQKAKANALREPISMSKDVKSLMEKSLKKEDFILDDIEPILPENKDQRLLDIVYSPEIVQSKRYSDKEQWISKQQQTIKNVIDEQIEMVNLDDCLFEREQLIQIPKNFFIFDFKETEKLITIEHKSRELLKPSFKRKWKVKMPIRKVNPNDIELLIDENITEFQVRFKVNIRPINYQHNKSKRLQFDKWNFSSYKTHMMDWKPFKNLKLQQTLDESISSNNIKISTMISNSSEKYIKYSEISNSNNIHPDKSLEYELVPLFENTSNCDSSIDIEVKLPEKIESISPVSEYEPVYEPEIPKSSPCKETKNSLLRNGTTNSVFDQSSKIPQTKERSTIATPVIKTRSIPNTGTSSKSSRPLSGLDSIIMSKRKKKNNDNVALDFQNNYPYLNILNQTTTMQVNGTPKPEMIIPEKENIPISKNESNKHNNILETSENEIRIPQNDNLFNIPDDAFVVIALNVRFAEKFGQAFLQFNRILDNQQNVQLFEFQTNNDHSTSIKLEYDMYMNYSCGAIFVRPINIYQRDINTKEILLFKQISEIAYQVQSLILVIIIDEKVDDIKDLNIVQFIEECKEYGIQIIVIENNAKLIAMTIIELVCKYGEFQNCEIEWNSEMEFLEACGVINPFLSSLILERCELSEFIEINDNQREQILVDICTSEMIDEINKGVETFLREEWNNDP